MPRVVKGAARALCVLVVVWPTLAVAFAQTGPLGSVRVKVPRANVRLEPSTDAMVLTQVTEDTILPLHAIEGDWFKVRLSTGGVRIEAYISSIVAERLEATVPVVADEVTAPSAGPVEVWSGISVGLQTGTGSQGVPPIAVRRLAVAALDESLIAIASALPASDEAAPDVPAGAQVTYVWYVTDVSAALLVTESRPRFIARFEDEGGLDASGLTAEIVRLVDAAEARHVVAAVRGRADQASWGDKDWDVMKTLSQQAVRSERDRIGTGTVGIQPTDELAPGVYGVVVRPESDDRLAGFDVLSDRREGALFGVVWVFTVG